MTIGIDDFVGFCFNINKVSNSTYELLYCLANLITNTTTMTKLHDKVLRASKRQITQPIQLDYASIRYITTITKPYTTAILRIHNYLMHLVIFFHKF